jgi:transcriptional regulator with XRE-family HTH domain
MNFTQLYDHLRVELLRRVQRGTLSVSLLARQTGLGQSHISNFLRKKRGLSIPALDLVMHAQQISAADLMPVEPRRVEATALEAQGIIPLVSHATALFEPYIRPSLVRVNLQFPAHLLPARAAPARSRRGWQRFVAVFISAEEARPMEPVVPADAFVLLDRHYNSFEPWRPDRLNVYAVRHGSRLALRYLDFAANRLVLRPHNIGFPVDLLEIPPGETPGEQIAGRAVVVLSEI